MPISTTDTATAAERLNVIIVGAGICGLACGAALRPFANVTIIESVKEIREIGAAVHLAPNAYGVIKGLGGNLIEPYGSVVCKHFTEWTPAAEKSIETEFDTVAEAGSEWVLCHRVDVQRELRRLATRERADCAPCELVLNTKIVEVDPEAGSVTSDTGKVFQGDVVIAADGIRSKLRPYVVGPNYAPVPSHHSAYRMLVPREKIAAHADLVATGVLDDRITIVNGGGRRIITYPCRGGSLLNFVCCLPDSELHEISEETWTAKGSVDALVESYSTFDPVWQKLLSQGEEIGLWQLRDQDPLPQWVKGRLILVGDSAHPMLPHQGQGASQALEDAEALGAFLKGVSKADVNAALQRVFKARYQRATETQTISRNSGLNKKPAPGEQVKPFDPLRFRKFSWQYYGVERFEKEHPEYILA